MLRVYVGITTRSKDISPEATYRVAKIITYPNFDSATFKNDLAILELEQDVPSNNENVGFLCLNEQTNTRTGTDLYAVGWGFTEKNFFTGL